MDLITVDPRKLVAHSNNTRHTKTNEQSDSALAASIKSVGIIQPPIVMKHKKTHMIIAGHRRVKAAIDAGLTDIDVLLDSSEQSLGKNIIENMIREPLNPVDEFEAIEKLVKDNWTIPSIACVLAVTERHVKRMLSLANIYEPIREAMRTSFPNENQLKIISSAPLSEQEATWNNYISGNYGSDDINWNYFSRVMTQSEYFAVDAVFDDETAQKFNIQWEEDLFAPADEDGRYTRDAEAFYNAQKHYLETNLKENEAILETNDYGLPKLPKGTESVYGSGDDYETVITGYYIDRYMCVGERMFRYLDSKPDNKGNTASKPKAKADLTQNGQIIMRQMQTQALHAAIDHEEISTEKLLALLVFAFSGYTIKVTSDGHWQELAATPLKVINEDGTLTDDVDTIHQTAKELLKLAVNCRRENAGTGIAGEFIAKSLNADQYLPNMATPEFIQSMQRNILENEVAKIGKRPSTKLKDNRAILLQHYSDDNPYIYDKAYMLSDIDDANRFIRNNRNEYRYSVDADNGLDDCEETYNDDDDYLDEEPIDEDYEAA